jgi:hypothetical protein
MDFLGIISRLSVRATPIDAPAPSRIENKGLCSSIGQSAKEPGLMNDGPVRANPLVL